MNKYYLKRQLRQFFGCSAFVLAIGAAVTVNNSFDESYVTQMEIREGQKKLEAQIDNVVLQEKLRVQKETKRLAR